MTNKDQCVPCPVCQHKIPFDTQQLLMGVQFVCANCSAAIGLSDESRKLVEATMSKLETLKKQVPDNNRSYK